ncbi:hypothetical protein JOE69_001023 [Arthrobacter russicus]|uniref:Uncharacterized protein n=1 Tax=Arthrobacter russicus TaxID=172040 RepID=A0ABU1J8M7_9MICC|nr:hypothetical protein [Arthrobacter russicus]
MPGAQAQKKPGGAQANTHKVAFGLRAARSGLRSAVR